MSIPVFLLLQIYFSHSLSSLYMARSNTNYNRLPKRNESSSNSLILSIGCGVVATFLLCVWLISSNIQSHLQVAFPRISGEPQHLNQRAVKMVNKFLFEIAIYFDDQESGLFLTNAKPNETVEVSAFPGQCVWASEVNGWERLATICFRQGVTVYSIQPIEVSTKSHRERHHPLVVTIGHPTEAMNAIFISLSGRDINLFYDDGGEGIPQGHLKPGQETSTNTYVGHVFYVKDVLEKNREIVRFTISGDRVRYTISDPENPAPLAVARRYEREKKFTDAYYNRTGIHWQGYVDHEGHPRPPPELFMWPAAVVGDVHSTLSSNGYWNCQGGKDACQSSKTLELELEVVSLKPRVFIVNDFLNDFEADELIRLASPSMHKSSVGGAEVGIFQSDTRTSRNTWVSRAQSRFTESLFRRAADLLHIDERMLHPGRNVEDIQVVNYENGQKYDAHHDWGVAATPASRYVTLLLYLNNQSSPTAGGETAFPKGNNGLGFKVRPKKGMAVLFYNLLEDGNSDDLALHAALPVTEGKKWLANFWVWDTPRGSSMMQ